MFTNAFFYLREAWQLALLYFFIVLLFGYLGHRLGKRYYYKNSDHEKDGFGALEAALFGLLGLILAFTFGMAGSRYESHKNIILSEANCIGTAILRADLYSDSLRSIFRSDFKNYLEARIEYFEAGDNMDKIIIAKIKSENIGNRLWQRTVAISKVSDQIYASNQMISSLNAMFDAATIRNVSLKSRVPDVIIILLVMLSVVCVFLAGYSCLKFGKKEWMLLIFFSLLISFVVYIIIDLDRPRRGLINASAGEETVVELRNMFK